MHVHVHAGAVVVGGVEFGDGFHLDVVTGGGGGGFVDRWDLLLLVWMMLDDSDGAGWDDV